jgi:hypothetical protein
MRIDDSPITVVVPGRHLEALWPDRRRNVRVDAGADV